MAKNKIITSAGNVQFIWGDGSRTISINPNYVFVSLFEDTLSFTLVGVPRPTGLSLFTTKYDDFELDGSTFSTEEEALQAIQDAFSKAGGTVSFEIVDELPSSGNSNTFYLLRIPNPEGGNLFEEYIWVENAWELVGSNGGSSIKTIYVGTSADSVNSGTCVINKVEGKKDWLNIVYADSDGYCNMTKINLNEFIIEGEFASGVTSLADGTVVGVVDPRQEHIVIGYNDDYTTAQTVAPLSVNESGFTTAFIQDAINAKVLIDRRTFTPDEGEYNKTNQEITFKSILDEDLFRVKLSGDTELSSGSTNFVENSAITEAFEDVKDLLISSTTYVASAHTIEYNNRKDEKLFETIIDVDTRLDSGSTNPVVNSAVTEAINDLEERKADWISAVTSGDVSASTSAYTLNYTNRSGDTLFSIELPKEEAKPYKAGRAIKIESGDTADTISFDLPIYRGSGADYHSLVFNYAGNVANKVDSSAFGRDTKATGIFALAEGHLTKANGESSHAEGYNTQANGKNSHAEGYNTSANNPSEHASGQHNISSKASNTFGDSGNTLFSVGNGLTGYTAHNALEIRQDGSIYISDVNAEGQYYQKPMILLQDAIANGGKPVSGISGVYVESGETLDVISGVVDGNSEKVVTSYNDDGTSAATANVLSVGADGFKIDNIQNAIDAKHANTIKLNGFTSGATEDLFAITSADTVVQAFMKIENKLYKDDNNGLIFDEGSDDTVILDGGTY